MRKNKIQKISDMTQKWILNNLHQFAFDPSTTEKTGKIDETFNDSLKWFCELAFMSLLSKKESDYFWMTLKEFILEGIHNYDWDSYIVSEVDFLSIVLVLELYSITESNSSILNKNLALKNYNSLVKAPHRQIEIFTYMQLLYELDLSNDINNLRVQTIFSNRKPAFLYTYMDYYSITHELFYIYLLLTYPNTKNVDYNLDSFSINLEDLDVFLLKLMVVMIKDENIDILGELLICYKLFNINITNVHQESIIDEAWSLIDRFMRKDGSIYPHSKYKTGKTKYFFDFYYHTTCVIKGAADLWNQAN